MTAPPLKALYKDLDMAIKNLSVWGNASVSKKTGTVVPYVQSHETLSRGTLIKLKDQKTDAVLLEHERGVTCYTHSGTFGLARFEISVYRDQSAAKSFKPMRLYMPYGKWLCSDGTEVLFNRDYCPIWAKSPAGIVTTIDPDYWIPYVKSEMFFGDADRPWNNKAALQKAEAILKDWGVIDRMPKTLDLFTQVLAGASPDILKPKNPAKKYPIAA